MDDTNTTCPRCGAESAPARTGSPCCAVLRDEDVSELREERERFAALVEEALAYRRAHGDAPRPGGRRIVLKAWKAGEAPSPRLLAQVRGAWAATEELLEEGAGPLRDAAKLVRQAARILERVHLESPDLRQALLRSQREAEGLVLALEERGGRRPDRQRGRPRAPLTIMAETMKASGPELLEAAREIGLAPAAAPGHESSARHRANQASSLARSQGKPRRR